MREGCYLHTVKHLDDRVVQFARVIAIVLQNVHVRLDKLGIAEPFLKGAKVKLKLSELIITRTCVVT